MTDDRYEPMGAVGDEPLRSSPVDDLVVDPIMYSPEVRERAVRLVVGASGGASF